jgi:hypothetical protein
MDEIPHELIKSFIDLGLLESEAKIYITLSMMNNSEVKTLIEFLGISKPKYIRKPSSSRRKRACVFNQYPANGIPSITSRNRAGSFVKKTY